ncbi:hypothetical protein IWX63_002905 [Arthrobacter sp. CAN_A2]|uniref:hypothetical protein n=1 Tax=Arthrobacter sp. CAN_A2 TaxID=2787718 RepID=UPI0018F024EF
MRGAAIGGARGEVGRPVGTSDNPTIHVLRALGALRGRAGPVPNRGVRTTVSRRAGATAGSTLGDTIGTAVSRTTSDTADNSAGTTVRRTSRGTAGSSTGAAVRRTTSDTADTADTADNRTDTAADPSPARTLPHVRPVQITEGCRRVRVTGTATRTRRIRCRTRNGCRRQPLHGGHRAMLARKAAWA